MCSCPCQHSRVVLQLVSNTLLETSGLLRQASRLRGGPEPVVLSPWIVVHLALAQRYSFSVDAVTYIWKISGKVRIHCVNLWRTPLQRTVHAEYNLEYPLATIEIPEFGIEEGGTSWPLFLLFVCFGRTTQIAPTLSFRRYWDCATRCDKWGLQGVYCFC